MHRKDALDALAVTDAADRERLVQPASSPANHHSRENLDALFIAFFYVASQPSLVADLAQLANRWRYSTPSQEELLKIMQPYLTHPLVVYSVFAFLAALVPLIEEVLKPVGMAFLVGRSITPAQGFAAGVLSGAGYALCESIFRVGLDSDWLTIAVTRSFNRAGSRLFAM